MQFMLKKKPNFGDYRDVKKFLFFPKKIGNRIRWLETASWKERYVIKRLYPIKFLYWKAQYWID